ncbi:MAG: UvrB/UvrC motif-containing protein [Patescibacteria group bacterium]
MINLNKISNSSGVYKFYNSKKELIYIGKATNLKSRVRSYFGPQKTNRPIEQMIHEIKEIKTLNTDSVLEAVILEANLIKKYQPKYNIDGKDDKSWNYILISKEKYPQVKTMRQHEYVLLQKQDEKKIIKQYKKIFGPYPGLKTKEMMNILQKIFHISFCQPGSRRACLDFQIGRCLGVCTGKISVQDYKNKVINPLINFLNGNKKGLIKKLEKKMKTEAKQNNFEEAARLRNQINNLKKIYDVTLLNKNFVSNNIENQNFIKRVEAYDISNLGEKNKVASLVVFEKGLAVKSDYRKFKIKSVSGQSDVDCLKEVFERRLKYFKFNSKNSFSIKPDLILVDGGKPQVNTVQKILKENDLDIPLIGIAKGRERKKNEFILGTKDREVIKWIFKNQKILIQARDEAHRFAITYQRKLMNQII